MITPDHYVNRLLHARALYQRFWIDLIATTDDPCDDLAAYRFLAADPTSTGRVIPTFRPGRYLVVAQPAGSPMPSPTPHHGIRARLAPQITTPKVAVMLRAVRLGRIHHR